MRRSHLARHGWPACLGIGVGALLLTASGDAAAQPRTEVEMGAHGGVLFADRTGTIFGADGAYRYKHLKFGGVFERIDAGTYRQYWSFGAQIGLVHRSRSLQIDALAEAGFQFYDDVPVYHRIRRTYIGPRFSLDWVIGSHFEIGPWLLVRFVPGGAAVPGPPPAPGTPGPPNGAVGGGEIATGLELGLLFDAH